MNTSVNWQPIPRALKGMFTAMTGRLLQPPLTVFKMLVLETCGGVSGPQCEGLVRDRLPWRRFAGLACTAAVPDETTLGRFRQRLIGHGSHERLLALFNRQLAAQTQFSWLESLAIHGHRHSVPLFRGHRINDHIVRSGFAHRCLRFRP